VTHDAFGSLALARLLEVYNEAVVATHAQHGDATALVDPTPTAVETATDPALALAAASVPPNEMVSMPCSLQMAWA